MSLISDFEIWLLFGVFALYQLFKLDFWSAFCKKVVWKIKPVIISIEGNIGSGKTTLLNELKEILKNNRQIVFIREPVDEWTNIVDLDGKSILECFYKDSDKYAFSFQMLAGFTRLANLELAIKNNPNAIVFITERSLETDRSVFAKMLYESGSISDMDMQIYIKWYKSFATFKINKIIYVKTSPEVCYERVKQRSRVGENTIPLEYLQQCDIYHEEMVTTKFMNIDKLLLDGNIDIYKNKEQLNEWVKEIYQFI